MSPLHRFISASSLLFIFLLGGCAEEFDTTPAVGWRGTLGEEVFEIVCQRMASENELDRREADPNAVIDVSGRMTRELCRGQAPADTAPTPRMEALVENRDRLVAALDATLPERMEDDLELFMLRLLPFYDLPTERLPTETREVAVLLQHMMADADAVDALERVGIRDGHRPLRMALGVTRPVFAYPGLRDFLSVALDTVAADGPAGPQLDALLEGFALELATAEADAPGEITTRDVSRDLLFAEHDAFASGTPAFLPLRDRRGLPVPVTIEAPFADMDLDGLADIDERGRFVDALSVPFVPAAPFATLGEPPTTRDADGLALKSDMTPLYQYRDVDRTLLAGMGREALALVDPAQPSALDFVYGLMSLLGTETTRWEDAGAHRIEYTGYQTGQGALFDVLHAVGVIIGQQETDDLLALSTVLLRDHEERLGDLIEAGHVAQANGDLDPRAILERDAELWDDLIEVATIMAEDGILEDVLRLFAQPQGRRLGAIYAELMRHRDVPALGATDRAAPHMTDQVYSDEVIRLNGGSPVREWAPGSVVNPSAVPDNMSNFQQTIGIIHDLSGAQMCNREGAYMRFGSTSPLGLRLANPILRLITFPECGLIEIEDTVQFYVEAITGRANIEIKNDFLEDVIAAIGPVGPALINELLSGSEIPDLTVTPTPEALTRLVFTSPTDTTSALLDPVESRYGDIIQDRYEPITLTWERDFHFCDDMLIEPASPCAGTRETMGFFEAHAPLLTLLLDHKEANPSRPFLFSTLIDAIHNYWSSPDNTMIQDVDPMAANYAQRGNGVSYENLTADLFANCVWNGTGPGRVCEPAGAGQFVERVHQLSVVLDAVEVRPGVDGIAVLARAAENLIDPAYHPSLTDRAGRATTTTNGGSRTLPYTPLYLLLDSLNEMDRAFALDSDPTRHQRWLAARSDIVDHLMLTTPGASGHVFENRRTHALLEVLIPFLEDRIAEHEALGDRRAWAEGLGARLEASMGSAVGSGILRFVDALQQDDAAREQLGMLTEYLVDEGSENDAHFITLLALADILQVLEDDSNMVPLMHNLSEGVAINSLIASLDGTAPNVQNAVARRSLDFLRDLNIEDEESTLAEVLANSVTLPGGDDVETPLETILDVIAEVNRVDPGVGGTMMAPDYVEVFDHSVDFLTDEDRGLERLYDVVQSRELP